MNQNALYKIGYGLYVLTACTDMDNGCIINTAMQVTNTPNRISVTVSKENKTHDMIVESGKFNLSILSEKADFSLFQHFGFQSGRKVNKFDRFQFAKRSDNGVYYITQGTNAYISGKVINTLDLGTHTMFIADVTEAEELEKTNSVTYAYYQEHIKPKPEKTTESKVGYRCVICGYVHEGKELPQDFVCPICKHGAADFEKI